MEKNFCKMYAKVKRNAWLQGMYWALSASNCILASFGCKGDVSSANKNLGILLFLVTPVIMFDHRPEEKSKAAVVCAAASYYFICAMCVLELGKSILSVIIIGEMIVVAVTRCYLKRKKRRFR